MNNRSLSKQLADCKYSMTVRTCCLYMLIATIYTMTYSCVKGLQGSDKIITGTVPKGTIKTIEVIDDGDIIDCVLFHKQPAFENPLLKGLKINHALYPTVLNKTKDTNVEIIQSWNEFRECPKGTIPMRRTLNESDTTDPRYSNAPSVHEYATVAHTAENCQGAKARLNVWQPSVPSIKELSLSQIWAVAGSRAALNTIEAGWVVCPKRYGSPTTRFFIFYTPDNYKTKCWDLDCGGFVQVDHGFVLGKVLEPSEYDGEQKDTLISISRDRDDGHWWLSVDDKVIGFWPHQLFTTLGNGADSISFGGEIIDRKQWGRHTITTMGSGHFPSEGYKKACYTSNIQIVNDVFEWVEPHLLINSLTRPECYSLIAGPLFTNLGSHFYFGGPGALAPECR